MSRNNAQEIQKKMTPQRQRFAIRKLSVGVASVLLGTTFLVGGSHRRSR
ncbi:YSIRK-type signal peptide-containing protein [Limosilactobacillus caecicola]|nr:YSIRK-type signal peptide-containing protein [Limosilactobacillus caecicola]